MRGVNRRLVLRTLEDLGEATRPQLASATGLSTVTVSAVLSQLVAADAVHEGPLVSSSGGRPSQLYRFHAGRAHVLTVFTREADGQDTLYLRVADLCGQIVDASERVVSDVNLATLESSVDTMMLRHSTIRAVGFGLPGQEVNGVLTATDYPELAGISLREHFTKRNGVAVLYENDVNVAAVGYVRGHALEEISTVVYLYFPRKYPPGAGILMGGRLHRGRSGMAGEVAYVPLNIPWGNPERFDDIRWAAETVAVLVSAVSAMLNPDEVVLHGEFLTAEGLGLIEGECQRRLPVGLLPRLTVATNFTEDLEKGLISLSLNLLNLEDKL